MTLLSWMQKLSELWVMFIIDVSVCSFLFPFFFFLVCMHWRNKPKNAPTLMLALLFHPKVAAITYISGPSSKCQFLCLFGSCSSCVCAILCGICVQKFNVFTFDTFTFSNLQIFDFWLLLFYRRSRPSLFMLLQHIAWWFLF